MSKEQLLAHDAPEWFHDESHSINVGFSSPFLNLIVVLGVTTAVFSILQFTTHTGAFSVRYNYYYTLIVVAIPLSPLRPKQILSTHTHTHTNTPRQ